jgi:4'-phosphopantetheinyl transferase
MPNLPTPVDAPPLRGGAAVHVWVARPREGDAAQLAHCRAAVSAEELARAERFRFEKNAREFLLAHALKRAALSRYAPIEPHAWRFAALPGGRPVLAGPAHAPDLRFNLSHTTGLVACAVSEGLEVGCDAESLLRPLDSLELAERHYAPAELRELRELGGAARTARFLEYWTLKEAYLKARGSGLRLPLDAVHFELGPGERIAARFAPELEPAPERWQFALLRPGAEHVLALAVQLGLEPRPVAFALHCAPLEFPAALPQLAAAARG